MGGSVSSSRDGQDALERRVQFMHGVVSEWLADETTTIVCGRWEHGTLAELVPCGSATLLPAAYADCFTGVRELRFRESAHHLHVDLGRVHTAVAAPIGLPGRVSIMPRGARWASRWARRAPPPDDHEPPRSRA